MQKAIFIHFLKDKLPTITLYLAGTAAIIIFFHLIEPSNTEIFYPITIAVFLLAVCLAIDWMRYYPTNRAIALMLMNQDTELQPHTEEQKAFLKLVHKMTGQYTRENNELKEQNKERLFFLSHWLHHLKTPVSVIALLMNKENQAEDDPEILSKIRQENNRLHTSIQQGLTMIRMESFENDLEVRSVDLLPSLRKLINDRKKVCIYQSIFPSIEFDGESAIIAADIKWNEILLEQLLSNAIKYSAPKPGSKKLILQIEKNNKHVSLTVKDEGIGIPAYDLERVFQPFFTGDNGRTISNSTGIGLYLSKKIAEKLGAAITIESEPSKGTAVTIRYLAGTDRTASKS
ncbi:sensor histidine kinase [Bacillus sp. FJAT-27225]|uniref:sensor histidine kinase n=1 Tax=Bacillus sp. FJAT-27225 TaxID=1743144 RepID=UPI0020C7E053|nr:sensor histidine kinase [Bacillus sp. FJAT-27225]